MSVPEQRVRRRNGLKVDISGTHVLYWMNAYRRLEDNFALDRALDWVRGSCRSRWLFLRRCGLVTLLQATGCTHLFCNPWSKMKLPLHVRGCITTHLSRPLKGRARGCWPPWPRMRVLLSPMTTPVLCCRPWSRRGRGRCRYEWSPWIPMGCSPWQRRTGSLSWRTAFGGTCRKRWRRTLVTFPMRPR